ncbi:amino acid permease [Kerstersia gyiorum]|uniref:Amino acid permease n=1 Tax=Kerstersia gyiorum TaxID=206506 RepID=A0A171KNZ9_9BURK|nr:amino acid permease [Kerstersia gyiorum]MCO7637943.1 amino acid permease [Pseudomonas sp. S 311-6]KKO70616.1 amino acid permease [Kerstersia gyiorum]MCP1633971.1 APA family basic amino acid/polyamine antiporter [Kerstersia gyiorum]MCP1637369.1 APA family basic amino acid/polyamine antiporter [Kerstersia gyiorum]MCP1671838.1 APA family basic amino acid/polyamine antiporter [Kerstersia gyiorum]
MFRRKSLDTLTQHAPGHRLVRSLTWVHLVALGIGAIVGTGIFTLVGVGAERAGPAVLLSFMVAGLVCVCAALAYAEMATMMPAAGGAYTYSYVALGEIVAWVVGWCLILEYSLIVSTVAVGWSGYMVGFLTGMGINLPLAISAGPDAGGVINLPAVLITFLVAGLLIRGTKESATFNAVLVLIKLSALALFVFIAIRHFDVTNIEPFMPYGFFKSVGEDGVERGVMAAAAIVFFAYAGFDAVATAAEEAKNPDRDLAIGIVGSLLGCTTIYIIVSLAALGAMSYLALGNSAEPLALILRNIGQEKMAVVIAGAAVIALPTVLLAFLYGQSRIFFVMARDGLLPKQLASVNPKTGTPVAITLMTTVLVASLAGVARLDEIAALANAGTLMAFVAVGASLLVMRKREPNRVRRFRAPLVWVVGLGAMGGCLYLFFSLPTKTLMWFFIWSAIGLVVYALYGRKKSLLQQQ